MKKLLYISFLVGGMATTGYSQDENFLNNSVCADPETNIDQYFNEYVQGEGHNFYQSYAPEKHKGSFSTHQFPVGTDDNPVIVFVDSSQNNLVKKYYYKSEYDDIYTGQDLGDAYISKGLWKDRADRRNDRTQEEELQYEETAFQCVENREDE